MQSDDYRHLREVFAEMALQRPGSPDGARWLAVAQPSYILNANRGHTGARGPVLTSPANGGTSEAPAPRRPAGQDRSAVRNCPTEMANVPNNTPGSIYRKVGA